MEQFRVKPDRQRIKESLERNVKKPLGRVNRIINILRGEEMSIEFWNLKQLADKIGVSKETVRRMVADGRLPCPDIGDLHSKGVKRWLAESVEEHLKKQKRDRDRHLQRAI